MGSLHYFEMFQEVIDDAVLRRHWGMVAGVVNGHRQKFGTLQESVDDGVAADRVAALLEEGYLGRRNIVVVLQ